MPKTIKTLLAITTLGAVSFASAVPASAQVYGHDQVNRGYHDGHPFYGRRDHVLGMIIVGALIGDAIANNGPGVICSNCGTAYDDDSDGNTNNADNGYIGPNRDDSASLPPGRWTYKYETTVTTPDGSSWEGRVYQNDRGQTAVIR